jgi:hypothetical protein
MSFKIRAVGTNQIAITETSVFTITFKFINTSETSKTILHVSISTAVPCALQNKCAALRIQKQIRT